MYCFTCKSDRAASTSGHIDPKLGYISSCDLCGDARPSAASSPDVYLGGHGEIQTDMNLHDPKTNQPLTFSSKREKAAVMRKLGVQYAASAERHHGARDVAKRSRYQSQ